jgi:tetratricopeptide (TPR) repeat protein
MTRVLLLRLGLFLAVILIALWGWNQVRGDVGLTFVYFVTLGAAGGFLAVKYFIPWLGDAVGTALFSSGEQVGDDPSLKAAAKLAQGDYEGAIAEHEKNLANDPSQVFPIGEIAKICADKLHDPARALHVLSSHLQARDWPEDDAAFLRFRMADIEIDKCRDYAAARALLEKIMLDFPDSRHRANAHHRLNELEQLEFKEALARRAGANS